MRVFGLIGLVLALVIVGVLMKKQLTAVTGVPSAPTATGAPAPNVREQSQQIQQQVKQQLDEAMQQTQRQMPDEVK